METKRNLAGRKLSAIGLGCMGMSEFYGPTDDEASFKALRSAFDSGYRHFDTSDMYGRGHNEKLLGRFLRDLRPGERSEAFVATKAGIVRSESDRTMIQVSNDPAYLREACERSLQRLGVETIDLFYLHRKDPATPIEETMDALASLKKEGKIQAIGLSEVNADTLRKAQSVHPVAALQSELSLWTHDALAEVLPATRELGVSFVAFSPLGRGFLAGGMDSSSRRTLQAQGDMRATLPRFQEGNFDANLALVRQLKAEAHELGCTAAQLALAWVLAQGTNVHAIPGSRRERIQQENFAAGGITLSKERLTRIDAIFEPSRVRGERYSASLLKTVSK